MNVFLDSCVLHKDYFFEGIEHKSSQRILEYTRKGIINLYMSDVVRLELRKQFEKELQDRNVSINKINKNAERLKIKNQFPIVDIEKQLIVFDTFYKDLQFEKHFFLLPTKNDFLPDIVNKAINKIKPFTENKSELKDALIWKAYSSYVEENKLSDCVFLTNNTSDFCGKDKSKVHSELLKDTERFRVVNSTFDFIKQFGPDLETPERKITAFIDNTEIDNMFVLNRIEDFFLEEIKSKIERKIERMEPSNVFDDVWMGGFVSGDYSEIVDCNAVEVEIIGAIASVYSILFVAYDCEVYEYNAARDSGEDHFNYIGDASLVFAMTISFDIDSEGSSSNLEIIDLNLHEVC